QKNRYRIVGPDELDNNQDYISIDSPLARALLGKLCDDEISLKLGTNIQNYYILEIDYAW
ncbi:MAG: transcription elongation factor GreB, partial [Gammaproteobacteria bacterium]|nr:transcription elongation factor GreB [Gammaproteobacteria bacterium]